MLAVIAEILFAALLLFGVLKREKLIAFERALANRLAGLAAGVIRRRRAARVRKARALLARCTQQERRAALRWVDRRGAVPRGCSIA